MSDIASHLKSLLELQLMEFYETWDLVDTHGWLIPEGADAEAFLADRAKDAEQEAAAVITLRALEDTIGTVPTPVIEKTRDSIGRENCDPIALSIIETIGFGFNPVDATEFVQAMNGLLLGSAGQEMSSSR